MASYTIGDVAEKCGINPVTLRAWQRRYGLIKPQRSEGGHRQFDDNDILRIEEIKRWISSGVPVSKVKAILDKNESVVNQGWMPEQEGVLAVLRRVRPEELRAKILALHSSYPVSDLIDHVYLPVRHRLGIEQTTARLMCSLLDGVLIEHVVSHLIEARQHPGKQVMLISWDAADRTRLWLEAWRLCQQGWHVDVLADPIETPRPELFPGLDIFLWTGKPLTPSQQEQLDYWREQGYRMMHHDPDAPGAAR